MSRQTKTNLLSLVALSLLVFIAAGTSKKNNNNSNNSNNSNNRPSSDSSSSGTISAEDLYAEFDADREAASSKYKGKTITVTGRVDTINSAASGNSYVLLKSTNSLLGVQCIFSGTPSSLSQLQKGERATFRGEVFAKIGNVVLRNCEVR
ncbi:MAG: OB-fold protein [Pyrinomonadaceae bacterium]